MSEPSTSTSPPSSLTKLNDYVSLASPPPSVAPIPNHPSVVLMFGWMDARQVHLQKYVEGLQQLFPSSTIVLIKSTTSYYYTSQKTLEQTLSPVLDIVRKEKDKATTSGGILVHVLSNGGGFQFMTLKKMLAATEPQPAPSTGTSTAAAIPTALILDSTPGDGGLSSSLKSMAPANPVLYVLAAPAIAAAYGVFFVLNSLGGRPPIFTDLRETLNAPGAPLLLPASAPRLYVYSPKDRITAVEHVEHHVADARAAGFDVAVERFDASPHVGHMRADPVRYWGAVGSLWQKAVASAKL